MALNSEIYVDKTGLLSYTNKVMDTKNAWICNSRPRRFGKSITADMLTAYYSKGCESARMFEGRKISGEKNWREHLNRYDVIHIDVQWCRTSAKSAEATVSYTERITYILSVRDETRYWVSAGSSLRDSYCDRKKIYYYH